MGSGATYEQDTKRVKPKQHCQGCGQTTFAIPLAQPLHPPLPSPCLRTQRTPPQGVSRNPTVSLPSCCSRSPQSLAQVWPLPTSTDKEAKNPSQ